MVFPLGSSNWSMVRISIIMERPQVKISARRNVTNMPDQMAGVKNSTASIAEAKAVAPGFKKNGCTYVRKFVCVNLFIQSVSGIL